MGLLRHNEESRPLVGDMTPMSAPLDIQPVYSNGYINEDTETAAPAAAATPRPRPTVPIRIQIPTPIRIPIQIQIRIPTPIQTHILTDSIIV